MTARPEPFRRALSDLRARLRDGRLPPGARVTAKDVAEDLRLSPTPVREALSRLAGEGVLQERRGDGFFVARYAAADIAALFRLSEQLLRLAEAEARPRSPPPPGPQLEGDPVRAVERLFRSWVLACGNRVLIDAHGTVAARLVVVRRQEPRLIADLDVEARALGALAGPARRRERTAAVRAFHTRRVALAEPLARLLAPADVEGL